MTFAEVLKEETTWTKTENGRDAKYTTGNACLDLFGCIGGLRNRDDAEVCYLFDDAYAENPLLATKILFYARDIRGGLGERKVFRTILRYAADMHPECVKPNIFFIGFFGRFDDLYCLVGTKCEEAMWDYMSLVFEDDLTSDTPTLLAKWIKTPDASSKKTRELGCLTARKFGYSVYDFKRKLRVLRKKLKVVECDMSANNWSEINYPGVPSRAMMLYRKAFGRHDQERFAKYIKDVSNGKEKINSDTLYPYDIVGKMLDYYCYDGQDNTVLEAQWKALPNYVEPGTNAIVIADVSGSMEGRPMASSVGLALYFAEHNVGAYHNLFMTFSSDPEIVQVKGDTLYEKVRRIESSSWGMNTDLEAAFDLVLDLAVSNNVPKEEMVKSLIVISDMEIDDALDERWGRRKKLFYDQMKEKYESHGYDIPNVVFWNVESRHDVFHADKDRKGVQLVSGQSTATFKALIDAIGLTPLEMMEKTINGPRYSIITVEQ